jgi:hypothetical protein
MTPLLSLPNLTNLNLRDCLVTKIGLSPSMKTLDLSGNSITDWSPLATSQIHILAVRRNAITDLAPFVRMMALDNGGALDVLENPVDCTTQIPNIWALQQRGVEVKQDCQP